MSYLSVQHLEKSFGKTPVLRDINLNLEKGQILSIIGSSGSGKTTLLRCLNFLETPDSGKIFLADECLLNADAPKKMSASELREKRLHFGLVFQSFNLFPQYTVMKNILLAPSLRIGEAYKKRRIDRAERDRLLAEAEEKAKSLLEKVGLSEKRDAYPCELSGGQQQRVSIARALALNPDILCFDEPTSALDPEITGQVLKVIRELADGQITMIIVTHEMAFARAISDRVIFMNGGVVACEGTAEEVFGQNDNKRLQTFLHSFYDGAL